MTLVRWRPMNDLMGVHNEIDRVFDTIFRGELPQGTGYSWMPAVDLRENSNEFTLVAEVPGVLKDDLRISLSDSVLTLRGEKKTEQEVKNENWHQVERSYGKFERHFHLSSPVDPAKIKAKVVDGVLTVTIPKAEEAKPREIRIDF